VLLRAANHVADSLASWRGVGWMRVDAAVRLLHVREIDDASVPDADVVIATNWETARPAWELAAAKGRRFYLVQDFHPYIAAREDLEPTWKLGFHLLAVSRWLQEMVVAAGVPPRKVSHISEGVAAIHRLNMPIEPREPSVVAMYGVAACKARDDAIAALASARESFGPFPVRLFGPNYARRPAGLPEWAEYHGLLADSGISELYNRSAVFVSSSLAEGFCMPAGEAMASGCAVASTDCGGIRDFAVPDVNALLSPPARPEALAANIVRLLRDRELRLALARAGVATTREMSWTNVARRLEAALREARPAEGSPPGARPFASAGA